MGTADKPVLIGSVAVVTLLLAAVAGLLSARRPAVGRIVILGLAVLAGGLVQSTIGFGMAVVAAPFVVLLAPDLMPAALLVPSLALPVLQLSHGVRDVAWRPLGWALAARLLLTPVGVAVVVAVSPRAIAGLVGLLILVTQPSHCYQRRLSKSSTWHAVAPASRQRRGTPRREPCAPAALSEARPPSRHPPHNDAPAK